MGFLSKLFKRKKDNVNNDAKAAQTDNSAPQVQSQEIKSCIETEITEKTDKIEKTEKIQKTEKIEKIEKTEKAEKAEVKSSSANGFFEIKKSRDDRYVFNLYASNHVIIATSQIYSSSQSALNGVNSVIANAEKANIEDQTLKAFSEKSYPKWEIYRDKAGQYRFRLCASNGSCICHSQGYTSKSSCKNGIESIIRTAKSAKIDKSYLKRK